jgi:hypothetical protein
MTKQARIPVVDRAVAQLPEATLVTLADYAGLPFADIAAERRDEISAALLDFLQRMEHAGEGPDLAT